MAQTKLFIRTEYIKKMMMDSNGVVLEIDTNQLGWGQITKSLLEAAVDLSNPRDADDLKEKVANILIAAYPSYEIVERKLGKQ